MNPYVTCQCGAIITDNNIDAKNRCNEEGEDYGVVAAKCEKCGAVYEASQWGEWDNPEDAKTCLQAHINQSSNPR